MNDMEKWLALMESASKKKETLNESLDGHAWEVAFERVQAELERLEDALPHVASYGENSFMALAHDITNEIANGQSNTVGWGENSKRVFDVAKLAKFIEQWELQRNTVGESSAITEELDGKEIATKFDELMGQIQSSTKEAYKLLNQYCQQVGHPEISERARQHWYGWLLAYSGDQEYRTRGGVTMEDTINQLHDVIPGIDDDDFDDD